MTRSMHLLDALPAAAIVVACAGLVTPVAAATYWSFHPDERSHVEVNGQEQAGARLLVTDAPDTYLVDLPAESKFVLVNLASGSASLLMRSEVKRPKGERPGVILIDQRSMLNTPSYTLHSRAGAFGFETDISEVHVYLPRVEPEDGAATAEAAAIPEAAPGRNVPAAAPTAGAPAAAGASVGAPQDAWTPSAAASDAARACVRLDARPSSLSPACRTSVYVRNSCDKPVVTVVGVTQRLMSGPLANAVSVLVPAKGEQWVGCTWWSGAMAPATHDLLGAGFLEPRVHHHKGGHHIDCTH